MKKNLMTEMCNLAGVPIQEEEQSNDTAVIIKALADTDYRDKDAYFKMVQLLKGLAVASEKDPKAKKYLDKVSDALTSVASKVEGLDEAKITDAMIKERQKSWDKQEPKIKARLAKDLAKANKKVVMPDIDDIREMAILNAALYLVKMADKFNKKPIFAWTGADMESAVKKIGGAKGMSGLDYISGWLDKQDRTFPMEVMRAIGERMN